MDLRHSPEELALRDEVRSWLDAELPRDMHDKLIGYVDFACALRCPGAIGAQRDTREATLRYTRPRKRFGTPIASSRVLRQRMVDLPACLGRARSMATLAASGVDGATNAAERQRAVSGARIKFADAALAA